VLTLGSGPTRDCWRKGWLAIIKTGYTASRLAAPYLAGRVCSIRVMRSDSSAAWREAMMTDLPSIVANALKAHRSRDHAPYITSQPG
jgi:hypothetical protein